MEYICTCGESLAVETEGQEPVECQVCGRRLLPPEMVAKRDQLDDKHTVTKGQNFRWVNPRGTDSYPSVAEVFYLTCSDHTKIFETELSDSTKQKAIKCPSCMAMLTLPIQTPPFGTDDTNTELGRDFYSFCDKCQIGIKERTRKCIQCGGETKPDPFYSRFLMERLLFMGLSIPVSIIAWAVTQGGIVKSCVSKPEERILLSLS
jgi:DNA-directed RNA polymerase subunit RPC12/RpoP